MLSFLLPSRPQLQPTKASGRACSPLDRLQASLPPGAPGRRAEGLGVTCQEPAVSASPLLLTSLDLHFLETSGLQSPLFFNVLFLKKKIHQHPLVYPATEGPANLANSLYSVLGVQRSALGQPLDPPSLRAQEVAADSASSKTGLPSSGLWVCTFSQSVAAPSSSAQ